MFFKKKYSNNKSYFKYKSFNNQTIDSLVFGYYWAQPLSKMNDIFEGIHALDVYIDKYEKESNRIYADSLRSAIKELSDKLLIDTGALCLTIDPSNQLMWAHYGDSYYGICIEYDKKIAFDDEKILIPVNYSKKLPSFNHTDRFNKDNSLVKKIAGNKSKVWEYEQEFRILHQMGSKSIVHNKEDIKAIYFGCRFDNDKKELIYRALKDCSAKYFQMVPSSVGYSFKYEEITDVPIFTHYTWSDKELGDIYFNYVIDAFSKNRSNSMCRLFIYTNDYINEDLCKSFYEHLKKGLLSDIKSCTVLIFHDRVMDEEAPFSYYSFVNDVFSDTKRIEKELYKKI